MPESLPEEEGVCVCVLVCLGGPHLVVEGADVQGSVSRGVLGPHVGPVEQEVLQVLNVSVAAGLLGSKEGRTHIQSPFQGPSPSVPQLPL